MHLIRLELMDMCPFWFIDSIRLTPDNPISEIIDFDDIPDETKMIIKRSIANRQIKIEDSFLGNETIILQGDSLVSTDDESKTPIIKHEKHDKSVDLSEVVVKYTYTNEQFDEAETLLKQRKNIIRSFIREMEPNDNNISLLLACLDAENKSKQRIDITVLIETAIEKLLEQLGLSKSIIEKD